MQPIQNISVLGGGSAGFTVALTLKRRLPALKLRVLRSPRLGIIGVGESTTPYLPAHFHRYMGLKPDKFYAEAKPTWKLGIRFLWGPRPSFNYTFGSQTDFRHPDLPKNNGYYCQDDFSNVDALSSMMDRNRAFARQPGGGGPVFHDNVAYHLENTRFVAYLEARARDFGIEVVDAEVIGVDRREDGGVAGLRLAGGGVETADLFVDASGFAAELLGKGMGEPFVSYQDALFDDRAVVGGWERQDETIEPFTTAETMDAGWCWRIDHQDLINRGYVFSSAHLSDAEAEAEFRGKNPKVETTHVIRFRTGRHVRSWVHNVVAIGNASGFVEPLEATALMCLCLQCRALADGLAENDAAPTATMTTMYNRYMAELWDEIRDFLSIHFKFNTRLDTPYWRRCRAETAIHGAMPLVEYYQENGPSVLAKAVLAPRNSPFGIEGYYTMLVGQQVPHARPHTPPPAELARWNRHRKNNEAVARNALDSAQALKAIRDPRWRWT